MTLQRYLLLAGLLFLAQLAQGQEATALDFKDHLKLAERFEQAGQFREAAEQYAGAYRAKPRKEEYAYKAAEYFYLIKDYELAAEHFALVKNDYSEYPLAGLNYARCLKQSAQFDAATAAYIAYLGDYNRPDRDIISQIVEQEVKGVALAKQEADRFSSNTIVEQLGVGINGPSNEFAPMPLAASTVYFISDRRGLTRMYRSDYRDGTWTEGILAEQFPIVQGKHVGGGTLSPAGDRFYVSLCGENEFMGSPRARCQLYVIVNKEGEWSQPKALPAYINTPGNSTSTPSVHQEGEIEVLLFASDRLDGYGGMDLYRCERYLNSESTDFTFPENLGPVVNSVADEVTPHYDAATQTLHFASNGFVNMGGFDVFRTKGGKAGWNTPENLRSPVNSTADDYYYYPLANAKEAMLASNRAFGQGKTRTSNEDLFLVKPGRPSLSVSLQVLDSMSNQSLAGVALAVFALEENNQRTLIASEMGDEGYFKLRLPMGMDIELDAQRLDYRRRVQRISVPEQRSEGYQLPPMRMQRIELSLEDVRRLENEREGPPVATLPTAQPPAAIPLPTKPATNSTRSPTRPAPVVQASPPAVVRTVSPPAATSTSTQRIRNANERSYRIQIEARDRFEPSHPRYNSIAQYGAITNNYIDGKGLHRIMVGDYDSLAVAKTQLAGVRAQGYKDAFVIAYDGDIYRGMARR